MQNDFLTPFIAATLSLGAGLLASWLFSGVLDIRDKLRAKNPQLVEAAAHFAVKAAEQAFKSGLINDKKSYAIQIAEDYLAEYKIVVNVDLLIAAIESAVWEEFNAEKQTVKLQAKVFDGYNFRELFNDNDD